MGPHILSVMILRAGSAQLLISLKAKTNKIKQNF